MKLEKASAPNLLRVDCGLEAQEVLESILERTPDIVFLVREDRLVRYFNPRAEQVFGRPAGEVIGRDFAELFSDSEAERAFQLTLKRRGANKEFDTVVGKGGQCSSPTRFLVSQLKTGLGPGRCILFHGHDIARERELERTVSLREQYLANIGNDSADAIVGVDTNDIIRFWNKGAELIFGYEPEEIVGKKFTVLMPEQLIARGELDFVRRETLEKGFLRDYETERITKDGRTVIVNITRSVIRDQEGRVIGTSAVLRDVTESRKLFQQVIQAEKLATTGQLATGLAHEIGTPLNVISGNAEYLMSRLGPDNSLMDELRAIVSQTERIADLIKRLLDFARPVALFTEAVDIHGILDNVLKLLELQLSKTRIKMVRELAPNLPFVYGDANQLEQVFLNIIVNAWHAMPDGGRLTLATSAVGRQNFSPTGCVEVRISDTGSGMPREVLSKIFNPFFTTKEASKGTGLGLAVSQKIVHEHRGEITAESEVGKGSTFCVRLPVAPLKGEVSHGD